LAKIINEDNGETLYTIRRDGEIQNGSVFIQQDKNEIYIFKDVKAILEN